MKPLYPIADCRSQTANLQNVDLPLEIAGCRLRGRLDRETAIGLARLPIGLATIGLSIEVTMID
jgi:hypothetical protein